ncbi:hemerythrin domain-containing protein [Pulveribacter suum]|uniref:Hemerythrin n=1 Tax=Pulveribacter suum TaxID=2116657 RepID=A0A2P1NHY9_9BURK|nr:hemerythrin domain-containing protein [Pulveribacter suum]AVP56674.1 hemerythrin [Pulveribacter suum]
MDALQWSEALCLDLPLMDGTHQEFVALLQSVQQAADAELPAAWEALVAHTAEHFAQEDRWMASTRFASGNCHTLQHEVVLKVLREGAEQAARGDLATPRAIAVELAVWFPHHTQAMDAALALHLRRVGFDPATGIVHAPDALPPVPIHGCGGACGSDTHEEAPAAAAA